MRFELLIRKAAPAQSNMEMDSALLESLLTEPRCILHFYEWEKPSATYGYFIDPNQFFDAAGVEKQGLQLARRPTGGGITFHLSDLAFSLLVPASHPLYSINPLNNYALINGIVLQALQLPKTDLLTRERATSRSSTDRFCMAKPSRYDILWEGRKVGGAAQRRVKQGLLHQGSLHLGMPDPHFLQEILQEGQQVVEAMKLESRSLLGPHYTSQQLLEAKTGLRSSLIQAFRACFIA